MIVGWSYLKVVGLGLGKFLAWRPLSPIVPQLNVCFSGKIVDDLSLTAKTISSLSFSGSIKRRCNFRGELNVIDC